MVRDRHARILRFASACIGLTATLLSVGTATAGSRTDVDIDNLDAYAIPEAGALRVFVGVEVEIDGPVPQPLEIRLRITDNGRPLIGPEGKPVEVVVPLDASGALGDDGEFSGSGEFALPPHLAVRAGELDVRAVVIQPMPEGLRLLAREKSRVRFPTYCPPACRHVGVSVGHVHVGRRW